MSTVLLTGATGFVGRHAVAALRSRGHEVVAVRSRSGAPVDGAARTLVADLLDGDGHDALVADAGASHLLHLAHRRGSVSPERFENLEFESRKSGLGH